LKPIEVIELKRKHLLRFSSQNGADGETHAVDSMDDWIPRPKGNELKVLLSVLEESGITIKPTSFDALALPKDIKIDFTSKESVTNSISEMVFIEIKTANQKRVKEDFTGYFFALTESEIAASEVLGDKHKVALFNKITGVILMTSVAEIVKRAKSTNWQVSVQL